MVLTPPQTPEEFATYLEKEMENVARLRDELNRNIGDNEIAEFRAKRKFLQNIAITSATLLGFVSAFSVISKGGEVINLHFVIGIALHLFLICFVSLYLRETIDKEIEALLKVKDDFNNVLQYKIELAQRYLLNFISDQTNIFQKFEAYQKELLGSLAIEKMKKENEQLNTERENRKNHKVGFEYNGEIVVFCFICGTILIFLSMLGLSKYLSLKYSIFSLIIIFYLTFTDSLNKILKPVFGLLTFITRKNLLLNTKNSKTNV